MVRCYFCKKNLYSYRRVWCPKCRMNHRICLDHFYKMRALKFIFTTPDEKGLLKEGGSPHIFSAGIFEAHPTREQLVAYQLMAPLPGEKV